MDEEEASTGIIRHQVAGRLCTWMDGWNGRFLRSIADHLASKAG